MSFAQSTSRQSEQKKFKPESIVMLVSPEELREPPHVLSASGNSKMQRQCVAS